MDECLSRNAMSLDPRGLLAETVPMKDDFWERNAENWTRALDEGAVPGRHVTNQALKDALVRIAPASVLDVGCGEGWLGRELRTTGVSYQGIDGSSGLVRAAREKVGPFFEHVPYENLIAGRWKPGRNFDAAVFNFSLFDEDVSRLLATTAGFLSPRGRILVQTLHPLRTLDPYRDGWRHEDFRSMPSPFEGEMAWFGRTLEGWYAQFSKAGLAVEDLKEPAGPEGPLSLLLRLRRPFD